MELASPRMSLRPETFFSPFEGISLRASHATMSLVALTDAALTNTKVNVAARSMIVKLAEMEAKVKQLCAELNPTQQAEIVQKLSIAEQWSLVNMQFTMQNMQGNLKVLVLFAQRIDQNTANVNVLLCHASCALPALHNKTVGIVGRQRRKYFGVFGPRPAIYGDIYTPRGYTAAEIAQVQTHLVRSIKADKTFNDACKAFNVNTTALTLAA